ncbi:MAG: HAD family phosphatase [Bacteroidales bacterium]|nr:HAD family phosphatase [Bacteroidales bacterium]
MVFIFDMDGVIVDNAVWHLEAFAEFGKRHGLVQTKEEYTKYFGNTNQTIMNSLFNTQLSSDKLIALAEEKEIIYRELYRPFILPVEGLPAFLENASDQAIPIALATSAPKENVDFTLDLTGLRKYFSIISDASMVKHGKPDPEIYLLTAAKLGVQPSDCIVFEDSIAGIQSALSAGMRVIGVATTHKPEELLTYVNKIIMNFDARDQFIKDLLQMPVQ